MSEERTNMAIKDLKHYVIDNMSLDVQDDFKIICTYIEQLQSQLQEKEKIIEDAIEYIKNNNLYEEQYDYNYEEELEYLGTNDNVAKQNILSILERK